MGVGIQCKACAVVAQHPGDRFDVHAVLESQGGEGMAEIVEADVGQARPAQHPVEHMQDTVRGHGAAAPAPGHGVGKFIRGHLLLPGQHILQLRDPQLILPLEQGQKDIFLSLKVVIDRGPGEAGGGPALLEAHGLVEFLAGVDDFVFPRAGQFRRALCALLLCCYRCINPLSDTVSI